MNGAPVIFISGTGRSGTNITKAILGKHSMCGILPFEYRFSIDPGGLVDFIHQYSAVWSPFMADQKLKDLESYLMGLAKRNEDRFAMSQWIKKVDRSLLTVSPFPYAGWELEKWMPGYQRSVKKLMGQLVDFDYKGVWPGTDSLQEGNKMYFGTPKTKEELEPIVGEFLNECILSFLSKTGKEVFVEDNTWSIMFADDMLRLVPHGKLIHIVRDPRDVVASLINQRWTPDELDHVLQWYLSVLSVWEKKKALLKDDQFLEIRLEDICSDTETTVKSICDFCNIDFEQGMINLDLSQSNSGRYKAQFSAEEIERIEAKLSTILDQYHY